MDSVGNQCGRDGYGNSIWYTEASIEKALVTGSPSVSMLQGFCVEQCPTESSNNDNDPAPPKTSSMNLQYGGKYDGLAPKTASIPTKDTSFRYKK